MLGSAGDDQTAREWRPELELGLGLGIRLGLGLGLGLGLALGLGFELGFTPTEKQRIMSIAATP